MKKLFFVLKGKSCFTICFVMQIFMVLLSCDQTEKSSLKDKEQKAISVNMVKIETIFQKHFSMLDSVLAGKYRDRAYPIERLQEAINFMESVTGILSKAEGTDIGRIDVKQDDIVNWKNWYTQNKHKLQWDEAKKRIVIPEQ
ncbi:MAG: hypothetical protein ACREOI_11050 [bacterium]